MLPGRPGGLLVTIPVTSKGRRASWRVSKGAAKVDKPKAKVTVKRELTERIMRCRVAVCRLSLTVIYLQKCFAVLW